jgi:hypothetical protein
MSREEIIEHKNAPKCQEVESVYEIKISRKIEIVHLTMKNAVRHDKHTRLQGRDLTNGW